MYTRFQIAQPLAIIAHEYWIVLSQLLLFGPSCLPFSIVIDGKKIESFSVASAQRAINKQLRNRKWLWLIYLHFPLWFIDWRNFFHFSRGWMSNCVSRVNEFVNNSYQICSRCARHVAKQCLNSKTSSSIISRPKADQKFILIFN